MSRVLKMFLPVAHEMIVVAYLTLFGLFGQEEEPNVVEEWEPADRITVLKDPGEYQLLLNLEGYEVSARP